MSLPSTVAALTASLLHLSDSAANPVRSASLAALILDKAGNEAARASGAAGILRGAEGTAEQMRSDAGIHIASVAKTMTAVLVFQAAEEGRLGDAGINATLASTFVLSPDILKKLYADNWDIVTVRHLLTHTSGLRDGQTDDSAHTAVELGSAAPNSLIGRRNADMAAHMAALAAGSVPDPGLRTKKAWRVWDPECIEDAEAGILNHFLVHAAPGGPMFPAGQGFHYSDTAFAILALLVEKLLGERYARLLRTRIFAPLGMHSTFLDETSPPDPLDADAVISDPWVGSVPVLTSGISLSNDWGGGGVVSTPEDLCLFISGLLNGKLFWRRETLDLMLAPATPPGLPARFSAVGCGIFRFANGRGLEILGHTGAWGAAMLGLPALGLYIAGTVNLRAVGDWAVRVAEELADLVDPR